MTTGDLFSTSTYGSIIYILVLILEFLYIIFAFILLRQVKLLNDSFNTPYEVLFSMVARVHFLIAIGVFALSILLL